LTTLQTVKGGNFFETQCRTENCSNP